MAGVSGGQNSVNASPLLGNLEHRIKIGGEIGFELLAFAGIAGAETSGDDVVVRVEDGDANLVQDKLLVVVLDAVDNFSGRSEAEYVGEDFRTRFKQSWLCRIGQTVVIAPGFEIFGDYGFDSPQCSQQP